MQTLLGLILAMSATMVLMPLLMRWAIPLRILDMPESRKVHSAPVPRVGGIAMGGGILSALVLWGPELRVMPALMCAIGILLCFGVWDDRASLSAAPKFAGQALAAVAVIAWGGVIIGTLTINERIELSPWIAMPLTFLFLLGGTNAFNLADGLDGLAGGMAMLCFCGTALLAFTVGDSAIGSTALVFVAGVMGFLRFNTHPARVFMGDGGSQLLGFAAAVLAVLLTQDPLVPLSTALPLLLMGLPIIDTLMVMTERLVARRSPFRADRRHIHHRLLALGFEHWQAVSILYVLQSMLFVAAWFLRFASDPAVLTAFCVFAAAVLGSIYAAQRAGFRIRRAPAVTDNESRDAHESRVSATLAALVLSATLLAFAVWVLVVGAAPSGDLRWLAATLCAVLAMSTAFRWNRRDVSWPEKIVLYSSATLAIYLSRQVMHDGVGPALAEWIMFPLMALAVVASARTSRERLFRLTPLDILVLVVVLAVPNLPDSIASARSLGLGLGEVVLLCYSFEALSLNSLHSTRWLRSVTVIFLAVIALRPAA